MRKLTGFVNAIAATAFFLSGCGNSNGATALSMGKSPIDSAPNSNASQIYFIGKDSRGAGIFRTPGDGSGAISDVLVGAPLVTPRSLVVSPDDARIYVADADTSGSGAVLVLDATNGTVQRSLAVGTHPRGVDVVTENGADRIYFSGRAGSGQPALLRVRNDGTAAEVLTSGAPFMAIDGVAATQSGDVYVTDTPGQKGNGRVIKFSGGQATEYLSGLDLGNPAGLAVTLDEHTLAVSALMPSADTDQVLLVDLATQGVTSFTQGIDQNRAGGGVHRAKTTNVFSWADLTAGSGGGGIVYRIELK